MKGILTTNDAYIVQHRALVLLLYTISYTCCSKNTGLLKGDRKQQNSYGMLCFMDSAPHFALYLHHLQQSQPWVSPLDIHYMTSTGEFMTCCRSQARTTSDIVCIEQELDVDD